MVTYISSNCLAYVISERHSRQKIINLRGTTLGIDPRASYFFMASSLLAAWRRDLCRYWWTADCIFSPMHLLCKLGCSMCDIMWPVFYVCIYREMCMYIAFVIFVPAYPQPGASVRHAESAPAATPAVSHLSPAWNRDLASGCLLLICLEVCASMTTILRSHL